MEVMGVNLRDVPRGPRNLTRAMIVLILLYLCYDTVLNYIEHRLPPEQHQAQQPVTCKLEVRPVGPRTYEFLAHVSGPPAVLRDVAIRYKFGVQRMRVTVAQGVPVPFDYGSRSGDVKVVAEIVASDLRIIPYEPPACTQTIALPRSSAAPG